MANDTVNITRKRYIELLESENRLLKQHLENRLLKQHLKLWDEGCQATDITKRIHENTGKTLKQWAEDNGFDYLATRKVACGVGKHKHILQAMAEQGVTP